MSQITIQSAPYSVSDFISWQRTKSLVLSPAFQRRLVWKAGAKSYLIDTILKGWPIPPIFLRELHSDMEELGPKREVVDGQQRLHTIISFVAPNLLKHFDPDVDAFTISRSHIPQYAGKGFGDLPREAQQRILDYRFTVHALPVETDDRQILQIFARMNATGVRLNAQEVRNAEYYGEFKGLCYQLAQEQLQRWREWRVFTEHQIARMVEVEFASELVMLMMQGITQKAKDTIDRFYRDHDTELPQAKELGRRFRNIFEVMAKRIDFESVSAFRKSTVFYCLYAALYSVLYGLGSPLKRRSPKPLAKNVLDRIHRAGERLYSKDAPKEVVEATERRTSHARSRKTVKNYLLARTR